MVVHNIFQPGIGRWTSYTEEMLEEVVREKITGGELTINLSCGEFK